MPCPVLVGQDSKFLLDNGDEVECSNNSNERIRESLATHPSCGPHEAFEIETDNHDGPAREQSAKGYVRNRANYSIPRFVKPQFRTSISAAGNG